MTLIALGPSNRDPLASSLGIHTTPVFFFVGRQVKWWHHQSASDPRGSPPL